MNIFESPIGFALPRSGRQLLIPCLSMALMLAALPLELSAAQDSQAPAQNTQAPAQTEPAPQYTQQTPQQLQQLVAPIALYPDSLTAQVLAAATFPDQVEQADTWVRANAGLKGDELGKAVDQQPWDPSVKALTAFPTVLGNMTKNMSWTSSLGDAYYNQQQDVMDAVQEMRQRAQRAGHLKSTPQQTVTTEGRTIVIAPGDPNLVYVPAYDPWMVYGGYMAPWPGWYRYPGIYYGGPFLSFGVGFGMGFYGGYGWGYPHWGFNWNNHYAMYNNNRYYSRGVRVNGRSSYYRGGGVRGSYSNRGVVQSRTYNGNRQVGRTYPRPGVQNGARAGTVNRSQQSGQMRSGSPRTSQGNTNRASHSNTGAARPSANRAARSGGGGSRGGGGAPHGGGGGRAGHGGGEHK